MLFIFFTMFSLKRLKGFRGHDWIIIVDVFPYFLLGIPEIQDIRKAYKKSN